jgi:hypothetical protein
MIMKKKNKTITMILTDMGIWIATTQECRNENVRTARL